MRKNILIGVGLLLTLFILYFVGGHAVVDVAANLGAVDFQNRFGVAKLIGSWLVASLALFTLFLVYVAAVVGAIGSLASKYPAASLVAIVVFLVMLLVIWGVIVPKS